MINARNGYQQLKSGDLNMLSSDASKLYQLRDIPAGRFLSRLPTFVSTVMIGLAWLGLASCSPAQSQAGDTYDIVIRDGRVMDPETGLDAIRNIGLRGDQIETVSAEALNGKRVIDASGLVVSPGFIDLHSHGQSIPADRLQAFDGVTTALELESGILPVGEWYEAQADTGRVLNYGTSAAWTFARIAEFEDMEPVPHLGWFASAFALEDWVNEPAGPGEIERIVARVAKGLEEGALGVGMNAGYVPGGGFREMLALHRLADDKGVSTFTHISCDSPNDPDSSAECIGQIIALAAVTGNHAHICHLNSVSIRSIDLTAGMVLAAQERGIPITTESYTYGASSTTIGSALFSPASMAAKNIRPSQIEYQGERLTPETFRTLRSENPGAVIIFHFLNMPADQEILAGSVLFPDGAIASDGMPWIDLSTGGLYEGQQWPLPNNVTAHPRGAGNFARLISIWVRQEKRLSLMEAIRKSSLIPAEILGQSVPQMRRKGRIQPGMDADIIVFDPVKFGDQATFSNPASPSAGLHYSIVGGQIVIDDGVLQTDARPGSAIRR